MNSFKKLHLKNLHFMRNVKRNNFDEYVEDETTRFAEKKIRILIIIFQGLHIVIQPLVIISKQKKHSKII